MNRLSPVAEALGAPYPVPLSIVALLAIVPLYIFIPEVLDGRTLHRPETALDRWIPVQPGWAIVYGSLYLYLILLPIVLIRGRDELRAAGRAYLAVWVAAYVVFVTYPTVAPRPTVVHETGFLAAGLRFLYSSDTRFNCFPSLHVAHSFVSAFVCRRVHRQLGILAFGAAFVVALSTLFTRQHYVADVLGGLLLASAAAYLFLRRRPEGSVRDEDRPAAALLATVLAVFIAALVVSAWVAYRIASGSRS